MAQSKTVTLQQLKTIGAICSAMRINADDKKIIVSGFSGGRVDSSKGLYFNEADAMIKHLNDEKGGSDSAVKMRRKIISYAHQLHWHKPGTQEVDIARLNNWCKQYGYLKKPLNDYSTKELVTLLQQYKNVFTTTLATLSR